MMMAMLTVINWLVVDMQLWFVTVYDTYKQLARVTHQLNGEMWSLLPVYYVWMALNKCNSPKCAISIFSWLWIKCNFLRDYSSPRTFRGIAIWTIFSHQVSRGEPSAKSCGDGSKHPSNNASEIMLGTWGFGLQSYYEQATLWTINLYKSMNYRYIDHKSNSII